MRGQKSKKILYHIGPRPAAPKPKMSSIIDWEQYDRDRAAGQQDPRLVKFADRAWVRHWLNSPVESGVFLTPSPVDVSRNHGRSGNVYAYRVPGWVIDKSGGVHRYDSGSEVLIPEDVWNEAGREIEFLGKSMSRDQLRDKIDPSQYGGPSQRRGQPSRPSWLSSEEMRAWDEEQRQKGMRSFVLGLRKTDHKEDLIKLFTQEERIKALEAFESLYPPEMAGQNISQKWRKQPGERRGEPLFWAPPRNSPPRVDAQIIQLLKKHIEGHIGEALLREYVIKILSDSPRKSWRRYLLAEAAMGSPELPDGVIVVIERSFDGFWVHYAPANFPASSVLPGGPPRKTSPAGEVEVSWISDDEAYGTGPYDSIGIGECGGAGIVTDSWVSPKGEGWGKILYDVAMEHATLNGGGLVSDRGHVSPAARGMWMRYLKMSGGDAGITKHQLKKFDTSGESPIDKDDCLQHSSTYDTSVGGLPKNIDWIDSALSKRYTKEPTTIDLLKSMGKLVDLT